MIRRFCYQSLLEPKPNRMKTRTLQLFALGTALLRFSARANDIEPSKEFYTAIHRGGAINVDGNLGDWAGAPVLADPGFAIPKGSGAGGVGLGACTQCVADSANPNYVLFEEL